MYFDGGDLRRIRYGGREVLQRVYVAVRDRNWGTVPNRIADLTVEDRGDSFLIRYTAESRQREIHFRWSAVISGSAEGEIQWSMEGVALSSFLKNRIGFCVLHPGGCAGLPCSVETTGGRIEQGEFPRFIAPHQPFRDIHAISHEVAPGVTAEVRLSGDVFEMEDQRNWTDHSFKTYSTPLDLPFPARIEAGTSVRQSVRLTLSGAVERPVNAPAGPVRIDVMGEAVPLPAIALAGAGSVALREDEVAALRRLRLSGLRVDLRPDRPGFEDTLDRAATNARALGVELECALPAAQLELVAAACDRIRPPVGAWLARGNSVEAARRHLGRLYPGARFAAGSDANFAELNRDRPDPGSCDALWFAANPQVHARDDLSMIENLAAQAAAVESARRFSTGKPVLVSPVTLKPRFNAVATEAIDEAPPSDPRQRTWFAAAWTLGSIGHLAAAGAAGITYYEIAGERGVLGFPVFDLLASVAEFSRGEVLPSRSSDPLAVNALILRLDGRIRALLANFTPAPLRLCLPGRTVEAAPAGITTVELS